MGVDHRLYLGPYIECTYKDAVRTVRVFGCPVSTCIQHPKRVMPGASGKYCAECGALNEQVRVQVPDRPDPYEVVGDELFNMSTSSEDPVWLGPNRALAGSHEVSADAENEEVHMDMQHVDPRAEIALMERAYASELEKLRAAYATVEVKWGLHLYSQ